MKLYNYNKLFFLFLFLFPALSYSKPNYTCEKLYYSEVSLKHRERRGVGFNQGYSTASFFAAPPKPHFFNPYVDARFHSFNSGSVASNLGVGARFSNIKESLIFGLNAYYDYRSYHSLTSHQGSLGAEFLTRWVDIRGSINAPFSGYFFQKKNSTPQFQGHYSYIKKATKYALPTADAEIGITLARPFSDIHLYLAMGGYYLFKQNGHDSQSKSALGGRVRLTAKPQEYIYFDVVYTKDRLFGSRTNGSISFNIPLGSSKIKSKRHTHTKYDDSCIALKGISKRYAETPYHQEIIPFYNQSFKDPVSSPENIPYKFIFVNNSNLDQYGIGAGSGTFEDPYTTLLLAQENSNPFDILYVLYGRGNDEGYNQGFTFQNNQILQGSGTSLTLNGVTFEPLTPGLLPLLSNNLLSNQSTIRANGVIDPFISGFRLDSINVPTIAVQNTNLFLSRCAITPQNDQYGLYHYNPLGISSLIDNVFYNQGPCIEGGSSVGSYTIKDNVISCINNLTGIFFENSPIPSYISHNLFSSNTTLGTAISFEQLNCSNFQSLIEENSITSGFAYGIYIQDESQVSNVVINNNLFSSNFSDTCINVQLYPYTSNYSVTQNTLFTNEDGINFTFLPIDSLTYLSKNTLTVSENTITHPGTFNGIDVALGLNAVVEANIKNNSFIQTSPGIVGKGISIINDGQEPGCFTILDNQNVYGLTLKQESTGTLQIEAQGSNLAGLCAQNNYISVANCSTLGPISYVPLGSPCPPFQAVFVNNTATAPGDGSYVYPYALLSDAQANSVAGDMIYVFTGDGTDTNYNTGFILKENQILTGSSTPFEYKGVIIEPLTSGPKPKISYSGPNNTIKTSCSCRVIGLDISSTGGNDTIWVYSPLSPPGSVGSIEKCSVSSENYNCIDLGDSNSNKTLYISNVVLFAKKASALIYDGNNSSFTWSLSDSVIESPTSPTSDPAIYIDIAGASNRISLTNNTINHPNESISISDDASSATFTLSIENNSLSSTSTSPIKCNPDFRIF